MIMNTFLRILLLICFSTTLWSQNITREFGKVSVAELKMDVYEKDTSAEAVVLFDIGKSYFTSREGGFEIIYERITRIKILSEAGLEWGEIEIPYYREGDIYEKVYELSADVYNITDGQVIRTSIDRGNIFKEEINEFWNVQKVVLPEVRPGSVIEYRYKIISQYLFNMRDWNFQWKIPVVYSEYTVKITPFYEYVYILKGTNKFTFQESFVDGGMKLRFGAIEYNNMVHRFGMENLPAFRDEEFITSINDHIIRMDFQLSKINYPGGGSREIMTTWPEMIKGLIKHDDFGKYIKRSEKLASKALDQMQLEGLSEKEKFNSVMDYVKETFKWNDMHSKYASKSAGNFVKDQFGNSADINLFAVGMLRSAGIEAHPVISSTRNNGFIYKDYPFSQFFNYVLITAVVDGETILADAASLQVANDRIPLKCINKEGLLIHKDEVTWVDLTVKKPSEKMVDLRVRFDESEMLVDVKHTATEYEAVRYRTDYGDDIDHLKSKLNVDGYDLSETSIKIENQNDVNNPWMLSYTLQSDMNYSTEKLLLSPFLNLVLRDNPLKQNSRTYPVDMMYSSKIDYTSRIMIPEGYVVEHIPQNRRMMISIFRSTITFRKKKVNWWLSFHIGLKNPSMIHNSIPA
jgi:hypothetical protein